MDTSKKHTISSEEFDKLFDETDVTEHLDLSSAPTVKPPQHTETGK